MKDDPRVRADASGVSAASSPTRRGRRVLRVIGLDPGVLEPRHVGEVGRLALRSHPATNSGKLLAIGDHDRRARLVGARRTRAPWRGTTRRPRSGARRDSAPRWRRSVRPRHCCGRPRTGARRARPGARASPPGGAAEGSPSAAAKARDRRLKRHRARSRRGRRSQAIARSARRASPSSVGQAGRSLSHSISVGVAPSRRIAVGVERPDGVANRRIVRVDQQRQARVVRVLGVAGEMDFADRLKRKVGEIAIGIEAVIGRADERRC